MNGFVAAGKTKLETEGSRVKGDSNTIPKTDFICSNYVWQGSYAVTHGIQDFRGHWQMTVGFRNHSARVYLYPTDCHTAVLCDHSLSVQAVVVLMSMSEKMHTGRAPKATQRVQNSPQHVLQPPEAIQLTNWVKVYPGSGAIFWGHQRSRWVT